MQPKIIFSGAGLNPVPIRIKAYIEHITLDLMKTTTSDWQLFANPFGLEIRYRTHVIPYDTPKELLVISVYKE